MTVQIIHNVGAKVTSKEIITDVKTFWYEGHNYLHVILKSRKDRLAIFNPNTDILNVI